MPSKASLNIVGLKALLSQIGGAQTGTKGVLQANLEKALRVPKLKDGKARVLSVDMGIRNLAFCVCDVEVRVPQSSHTKSRKPINTDAPNVAVEVVVWQRLALDTKTSTKDSTAIDVDGETDTKSTSSETTIPKVLEGVTLKISPTIIALSSYTPAALAPLAYSVLTSLFLPHAPSTILIEQQRSRSQSSAAIQEWTYRVNMLEAMLWAVLETLKGEKQGLTKSTKKTKNTAATAAANDNFPEVFAVSPARVGEFWMSSKAGEQVRADRDASSSSSSVPAKSTTALPKHKTRKVEKKDKVALVAQWLTQPLSRTLSSTDPAPKRTDKNKDGGDNTMARLTGVQLTFSAQAEAMRAAFLDRRSKGGRKRAIMAAGEGDALTKLDDLADCLLQATAWARWEGNRRELIGLGEEELVERVSG
ncbi:mitochondrial resolvase Ydc2 [Saccharata proteae CBS 121410]|uniref:Mitochondrial resolvase Ydc2 n=1 Tax=Saccharata proteae CBS 121410 TaxID=1314787 RepID=A0A9P4HUG4_9PEZI|nr:mitochondrial resolvase Ydc2 [Saccharata proteae CBS 121410]